MARTILSPERGIQEIYKEFKTSILRGCKFFFIDFIDVGLPAKNMMTHPEMDYA
jgi:hypothetical protein